MPKPIGGKPHSGETERRFGETLRLADPGLAEYVARYEALLERVDVLERALLIIAKAGRQSEDAKARMMGLVAEAVIDVN